MSAKKVDHLAGNGTEGNNEQSSSATTVMGDLLTASYEDSAVVLDAGAP